MNDRADEPASTRATVIVGPFSSEPFALGLRALLVDSGEFDVVSIDDPAGLGRDRPVGTPSILIVEGADPALCGNYLDAPFIRLVVLFDPVGARAFVGLENPDWRQLAEVVRITVQEVWGDPPVTGARRVRVLDPRTLLPADVQGADSAAMAPLTEWLELSLGRALMRRIGREGPGVPGWSISPDEAIELLSLDPRSSSATELSDRLTAADDALVRTRRSLPGAVARIAEVFALSDLELRLLCLVLAPELDGRYATVIGVLQDDVTRRRPGLTLLAEVMARTDVGTWDLRRAIHASNSVTARGLVRPTAVEGLQVDVGLAPSRAVVAHLLAPSIEEAAAALESALRWPSPATDVPLSGAETPLARRLEQCIADGTAAVQLVGGGPAKGWFLRLAAAIGLPLVIGDLENIEAGPARVTAVGDWGVLSRLAGSGLMVLGIDALPVAERRQVAAQLAEIARGARLVATDGQPSLDWPWRESALPMRAPTISTAQRAAWWSRAAARTGLALGADDIQLLAATAPIDPERIDRSAAAAAGRRSTDGSTVAVVQRVARELSLTPLPQGVRRLVPTYGWDDIVLSGQRKELLQEIPLHVLQAGRVLEEWGFASRIPYGQGVAALFSGPSGTGKTMAAQIVAGALGVDLFQVDLSKTISKYIGETEKNLDGIFDAAEAAGSVLLFDEADAIFGKRTQIKDAHDRHANVEVAYLLQRIESFRGLAILTTNFKQNIDDAFVRRLRFVVEFALPDATERHRIWLKAFPKDAPLARDVDVARMAGRLQIPGGSIQNIALHAAFLAAGDGGPITATHLLAATRRELIKIGMLTAERCLDELAVTS